MRGKLPASRIGRRLLIDPADLRAMLDAERLVPAPARGGGLLDLERRRADNVSTDKTPRRR